MALYITGDTHGDFRRFLPERFPEQEHLTKEDMVLICGDFGGVWYGDHQDDEELDFLEARPFTTLFVTGNHENYDALNAYPLERWHGGTVRRCASTSIQKELLQSRSTPDALTDFLEEVRQRYRFQYWFFGHYHDNGIVREQYVLLNEQMIRVK